MNYNGSFLTVVLKVGGGNNHSVMAHKLPRLHIFYFATHKNVGRGEHKQLVALDVKCTRASDDLVVAVYFLCNVFNVVTAYLLCHIPFEALTVGIFAFGSAAEYLFKKSHCHLTKA